MLFKIVSAVTGIFLVVETQEFHIKYYTPIHEFRAQYQLSKAMVRPGKILDLKIMLFKIVSAVTGFLLVVENQEFHLKY